MSGMRTSEGERTALLIRLSQVQLRTVGTIQALQETKPQIRRHPQQKQNDSPTRKLHTSHRKIRPRAEQHAQQLKSAPQRTPTLNPTIRRAHGCAHQDMKRALNGEVEIRGSGFITPGKASPSPQGATQHQRSPNSKSPRRAKRLNVLNTWRNAKPLSLGAGRL